jgi:DNA modification methylase
MSVKILIGDVREKLKELADESVHCVVTSPPYWGLRDYGVGGQIGMELTWQDHVENIAQVFDMVKRVLRKDGTLWLNYGDSYAAGGRGGGADGSKQQTNIGALLGPKKAPSDLKPKDLCGIPWRVAFALQERGWYLRQDIIWCLSGGAWLYASTSAGYGPVMLKDLVRLNPETVELWNGLGWTKVTQWTKRPGRAEATELVLRSGERVSCTANHVWPTQRGNLRTDELKAGDVLQTTKLPDMGGPGGWITDNAFWFAGLYLAEGSRSGETIQIAGHIKEVTRAERIKRLVEHYGGSARVYNHKGNSQSIHVDSVGLAAIVKTLVAGRTAKDKHLAPAAWQYSDWCLQQFVFGYLEGDGHHDLANERVRLGFCRNYALERDLRCLAARLGATLTLNLSTAKNQTGSFPSFKGEWRWERSGHHNEKDRGEIIAIRRSRARQFWDVTVADDPHLFALSSGVLTHNSKPNPMPESVKDRCTKAHEYVFLLTKSPRYYFDAEAIAEPSIKEDAQKSYHRADNAKYDGVPHERWKDQFDGRTWGDAGTRNKRSVWEIATSPFPEAHFATFPPELPEICIKAGTSEKGCCAKCGKPWVRITEPAESTRRGPVASGWRENSLRAELGASVTCGTTKTHTIGWLPSCECNIDPREFIPCTVLDPFAGAGTTGLVADRLQRNAVLIELNPEYAAMAEKRISNDAPMFTEVAAE